MSTATHHIIEIPKKDIKRYLPKELAHCNTSEYNAMCQLIYNWQTGVITYEELRVQAIYYFLNLKKGKRYINKLEKEIFLANLYDISMLVDTFFTQSENNKLIIKQNYTHNHNPVIKPVFVKMHGPKSEFENVTFGQYQDALNLYHMYNEHTDPEILYRLMATFYLYKNEEYQERKIEKKISKIKLIDFGAVYGFFLFFGSFQIYLTSSIVYYEGKPIDFSILYKSAKNAENDVVSNIPGLGVKSLAYQLAESGVFGNLQELRKENLWEILLRLYDIRKRDLDAEAKEKAKKTTA